MADADRQKFRQLLELAASLPEDERRSLLDSLHQSLGEPLDTLMPTTPPPAGAARPAAGAHVPSAGDTIDRYRLIEALGEGGMGVVWRAEQERPLRRDVALKLVKPTLDHAQVLARFDAERAALARMDHPAIARVFDAGATEYGIPYFVMELVRGEPLVSHCDARQLALNARLALFVDVCDGVQHAHQKGIIHRDLKPSNILVQERDGGAEVKIIDFGIARAVDRDAEDDTSRTRVGTLMGTPQYMSPEQAEGRVHEIDTRTDVYALGVILYELLTGRLPFETRREGARGLDDIRRAILEDEPTRPSTCVVRLRASAGEVATRRATTPRALATAVRRDLDWITVKSLAKSRDDRYDSAAQLAEDVRRFLRHEPVQAGAPGRIYQLRKFVRRHRVAVGVTVVLIGTILAGAAAATVGFVRASRAERQSRYEADTATQVVDFMVDLFRISDPSEARGASVTAREVLDRGVDDIGTRLEDRPDVRARLLDTMGLVYRGLGLQQDAEPVLRDALTANIEAHGAASPQSVASRSALAGLLLQQRRQDEARPILEEALEIQRRAQPPDDLTLARLLNNLGTVERLDRRPEAALEIYEEAYRLRAAALGADAEELIGPLANIASLHRAAGRHEEAADAYVRAIDVAGRALPPNHPTGLRLLGNLGQLQREMGRLAESRATLEALLPTFLDVYGPDHGETCLLRTNLARTLAQAGDLEGALVQLDAVLAVPAAQLRRGLRPAVERLKVQIETEVARRSDASDPVHRP